jgi:hypothetical protein
VLKNSTAQEKNDLYIVFSQNARENDGFSVKFGKSFFFLCSEKIKRWIRRKLGKMFTHGAFKREPTVSSNCSKSNVHYVDLGSTGRATRGSLPLDAFSYSECINYRIATM